MSFQEAHPWIKYWFSVSAVLMTYDGLFCLLRPRSLKGGDLFWIWQGYEFYSTVEKKYSVDAWISQDPFPNTQAWMNVVEAGLSLVYVFKNGDDAALYALASSLMTFWKTALYFLLEIISGWESTGHATRLNWWGVFFAFNIWWLIIPLYISVLAWKDISSKLRKIKTA